MKSVRGPRKEDEFVHDALRRNEVAIDDARREASRMHQAAREARLFVTRGRRAADTPREPVRSNGGSSGRASLYDRESEASSNASPAKVITLRASAASRDRSARAADGTTLGESLD
jgi:hypothetical protein